ncbi:hypothetical protein DFH09DRAFT_1348019 [Mycena vulgaris]|nr:hypothetical protein DFH09DRAFT_1348019 [Mycena vulgaris]
MPLPFFKYTLPLTSEALRRSSGQRCTRLFHLPRCVLRVRRRHAGAHGLLFTAAISIYDLRARFEAQIHGYYPTADRLVIIGLVGGLDYKNPMIPCAARSAGAERLAFGALTLTEGGLRSAAVVDTAKIKGLTKGCGRLRRAPPLPRVRLHHIACPVQATPPPPLPPPPLPAASHATASNASDHSASSASESADRRSSEAKTVSLRGYSAAFPGSHAHVDLWAVRNVCPASPRASGSQGAFSAPGGHDAPGAGAVELGTPWEGPNSFSLALTTPSMTSADALATRPAGVRL